MAQRRWTSQFSYSMERMACRLRASFIQSGSAGTAAVLASQGVTYTANTFGTAGNSISVTITGGATAGAEVVTVVGNAISIQIESGVSSITQVRTAANASTAAAALITATGTSASAVSTHALQNLATGTDAVFTQVGSSGVMSMTQINTGLYRLTLRDPYTALISLQAEMVLPTAKDLKSQVKGYSVSNGLSGTNYIDIRTVAVATATNMASADGMLIDITLRNSSSNP